MDRNRLPGFSRLDVQRAIHHMGGLRSLGSPAPNHLGGWDDNHWPHERLDLCSGSREGAPKSPPHPFTKSEDGKVSVIYEKRVNDLERRIEQLETEVSRLVKSENELKEIVLEFTETFRQ